MAIRYFYWIPHTCYISLRCNCSSHETVRVPPTIRLDWTKKQQIHAALFPDKIVETVEFGVQMKEWLPRIFFCQNKQSSARIFRDLFRLKKFVQLNLCTFETRQVQPDPIVFCKRTQQDLILTSTLRWNLSIQSHVTLSNQSECLKFTTS